VQTRDLWNPSLFILSICLLIAAGCGTDPVENKDAVKSDGASVDGGGDASVANDSGADGGDSGDSGGDSKADTTTGGPVLTARSLRFNEDLLGVWGSSLSDVWWVGRKGTILHDNGAVLAPRGSGTNKDLHAVGGLGPNEVWFAGQGVVLRWNGKKILDRTPPDLGDAVLRSVVAPPDGSTLLIAGDGGLVYRLVKGLLVKETTGTALRIRALRAVSAGNIWAIGDAGQGLHLTGGTWGSFSMPGAADTLFALDAGPTGRLFAVGAAGFVAATEDKTWTASLSNDPKNRDLYALWALSDTSAFALGKDGALIEFKGKKWGVRDIDGTYMKTATFRAAWGMIDKAGAGAGYAVGDAGAGLRYDPLKNRWEDKRAETAAHVLSTRKLADGRIVAVGGSGLLLTAADISAPFVDLGVDVTGVDLEDACDDGNGGVWAVGDGGLVVHVAADGTTTIDKPQAASGLRLRGVTKIGETIVAVGVGGVAIAHKAGSWSSEATGVQFDLHAIAVDGATALAVGAFGTILRRGSDGTWQKENSGGSTPLHRVVVWNGGEAVAVGDNGLIISRNPAGTWTKSFEKPGLFLFGVDRYSDGRVIAVGWQGSLVIGNGGVYTVRESGVPNVLRAVATDGTQAVAVGHKGGIYQIAEGL
jgi:hypothetical protein